VINYYKLYGLSPLDSLNSIKKTLKAKQAQYEKEITLGENVAALQSQLGIVIEAMGILLDSEARESYDEELAACPPSDIKDPFADIYYDYESVRTADLESWKDVCDFKGEVNVDVYRSLLRQSTIFPHPEIQENIVLAMILTPSALANMLPIGFSFGASGTGKSQISNLVSRIWGGTPAIGSTSFATLRRMIGAIATAQHNGKIFCLNNALCWDDLSPELLRNEHIYSLLKSAVNRATSIYRMPKAQTDEEIIEIQCFGLRFVSSVYAFFADPNFIEMNRRMLIIECKKSLAATDTIDFESIDWSGLKLATNNYWSAKAPEYAATRKKVVRWNKAHKVVSPERAALCTDLVTTGLTMGIWGEPLHAAEALKAFYQGNDNLIESYSNPLKMVLLTALKSVNGRDEIAANVIKDVVTSSCKSGLIDHAIKGGDLTRMMRTIGWTLDVADRVWRKVT
jgi:hypothetical protein